LKLKPLTAYQGNNLHFKKHFDRENKDIVNFKLEIPIYKIKDDYKLIEYNGND
jgi:hypothetical protein